MIALSLALSFLGCLALAGFGFWLRHDAKSDAKIDAFAETVARVEQSLRGLVAGEASALARIRELEASTAPLFSQLAAHEKERVRLSGRVSTIELRTVGQAQDG